MKKVLLIAVASLFMAGCTDTCDAKSQSKETDFVSEIKFDYNGKTSFIMYCIDGYQYLWGSAFDRGGLTQMTEIVETEDGTKVLPIKCY